MGFLAMDTRSILEQVQKGTMSLSAAEALLRDLPYEDLGFAKLDHHRTLRSGRGEVVFCAGKADAHLAAIFERLCAVSKNVLGTRAAPEQFERVRAVAPEAVYDSLSRLIRVEREPLAREGCVAVCAAGTSDLPVAEEAAQTAEFYGANVTRIYDVGVAGIHRLLAQIPALRKARCVIAAAGMEGALGSVVAGLVDCPVVGLPTSVGYGASFNGLAPLLTMLNSCAAGMAVVNIDNGFGAGYLAAQINGKRICE